MTETEKSASETDAGDSEMRGMLPLLFRWRIPAIEKPIFPFREDSDCLSFRCRIFSQQKNMSNMIIETIKRLSIDVFVTIMAIAALGSFLIALLLVVFQFCK